MLVKPLNKEILNFFSSYIESEVGIVYSDFNEFQLIRRLEEIALLLQCRCVEDLYSKARSGIHGDFKKMILDVATNNETSFFRDQKVFEMLESSLLPLLAEKAQKKRSLRIWCAASSSGQEPLSLNILIKEFEKKNNVSLNASILATDISQRILEKAKLSTYSQLEIQRGLPTKYMLSYFHQLPSGQWVAKKEISENITYQKLNLKHELSFAEDFDLILCRNVLIYQSVDSKKRIVEKIINVLSDQGILLLGAGESLLGITSTCDPHSVLGAIYYKKSKSSVKVA